VVNPVKIIRSSSFIKQNLSYCFSYSVAHVGLGDTENFGHAGDPPLGWSVTDPLQTYSSPSITPNLVTLS